MYRALAGAPAKGEVFKACAILLFRDVRMEFVANYHRRQDLQLRYGRHLLEAFESTCA